LLAESDQIVVAMRELGLPVEYIVAKDEGHGFAKPVNNMAFLAAAEKFLANHLGGRYQEDMPEDVAKKLEELIVDINTVELPEGMDEISVELPQVAADLEEVEYAYEGSIAIGEQTIPLNTTLTVTDDGDKWVVNEVAQTPMGPVSDMVTLKKGSLEMISREVKQGPATINMDISSDKITGSMVVNGNNTPIDQELEAPLFADGGGASQVMAQLPLKEGYMTYFQNYDMQSLKVKTFKLEVAGTEEVTVPAGTFTAHKVEVTSAEGEPGSRTLWVATDGTHRMVKMEAVIPQMNGAVLTSELK
ncbi:MAG: DUF3108 domain-containing protein, partial [Bacteroidota bacterium]